MEKQNNSSIELENEITPTSHKVGVKANLPNQAVNELGLATANLINTITKGSDKVFNMFCNSMSTLGAPVAEILKGKTAEIKLNNQSIYAKLAYTKEVNMRRLSNYVAEEFNQKVLDGKPIPERLEDTDNLLLIQDNASTTSNETLLKMWSKLYTEEACNTGAVNRKAIKLVEALDAKTAKILEEKIFPFCDDLGIYWGDDKKLGERLRAMDYGFLQNNDIQRIGRYIDYPTIFFISDYKVLIHPGYNSHPDTPIYRLTISACEIRKCLNIQEIDVLDEIKNTLIKNSPSWVINKEITGKIKFKKPVMPDEKFIICKNNTVIFPTHKPYKTIEEYQDYVMGNIEFTGNYKNWLKINVDKSSETQ